METTLKFESQGFLIFVEKYNHTWKGADNLGGAQTRSA